MRFFTTSQRPLEDTRLIDVCYLVSDNWDDFTFKTSFSSVLFDERGKRHDLGGLKILSRGQESGRVDLPSYFDSLDGSWCSVGVDRDYYVNVSKLKEPTRTIYLQSIRDCVFDQSIFHAFENEDGMQYSLLRSVSRRDVLESFPRILSGDAELTPYEFVFEFHSGSTASIERCEFAVKPYSKPPTNIHVLIGRNGVGKTRLLAGMADALTENKTGLMGLSGNFVFADERNEFLNLIVVSYSAFDRFDPIDVRRRRSKVSIPYYYIGIKKHKDGDDPSDSLSSEAAVVLKHSSDFDKEFSETLKSLLDKNSSRYSEKKFRRWDRALNILRSDPGLADIIPDLLTPNDSSLNGGDGVGFSSLSSGHKIVLLTIARLVDNVSDRSLVILDEPETHLHPPLLGSFIRAISELLISQNGAAIVATHSPVVLQEVPARCVSVISRSGERIRIRRPNTETFAENVGMLTRRVFGLEVTQSGFYRMLKEAAKNRDFGDVIQEFGEEIGGEGRALARVFTSEEDEE